MFSRWPWLDETTHFLDAGVHMLFITHNLACLSWYCGYCTKPEARNEWRIKEFNFQSQNVVTHRWATLTRWVSIKNKKSDPVVWWRHFPATRWSDAAVYIVALTSPLGLQSPSLSLSRRMPWKINCSSLPARRACVRSDGELHTAYPAHGFN